MGLDWRTLSLGAYLEALDAFNDMHDPEAAKKATLGDVSDVKRFMAAHTIQ